MEVVNQLKTYGEDVTDRKKVEKLLRSPPPSIDMLVIAIEEIKYLAYILVEEIIGSMLNHESNVKDRNHSLEKSFQTQATISRGRGKGNRSCDKRGVDILVIETMHQVNLNNHMIGLIIKEEELETTKEEEV